MEQHRRPTIDLEIGAGVFDLRFNDLPNPRLIFLETISHPVIPGASMTQKIDRRRFTAASIGMGLFATSATHGSPLLAQDEKTDGEKAEKKIIPAHEAPFERDYDAPKFKPSWKNPQVNRLLGQDFVVFAHSDLEMTKKLLEREPGLLNASIDWGNGDFETALGGASHMGRKDIVKYLLSKGARIDIFCATMLGMLDSVKEMLKFQPGLIDAKGPHGFSLHFHAQVGQEDSKPVLDYLQSIKEVELRPVPFLKKKKAESEGKTDGNSKTP
jgi:ankyrin repeat protein